MKTADEESLDLAEGEEPRLLDLAAHYRLIDPESLEDVGPTDADKAARFRELRDSGWLDSQALQFLARKAAWLELENPEARPESFIVLAVQRGYLRKRDARELVGTTGRNGQQADYEAAVWCYALGLLSPWQIIDLLEEAGQVLFNCATCRMAFYPGPTSKIDRSPSCPDCAKPLALLTHTPRLGMVAPPLPVLPQLRVQPLDSAEQSGPARHVVRLARHYRLITAEQAELASLGAETIEGMARQLLEDGLLTTTEFRFLIERARQTLEAGEGTVGGERETELMTLAANAGYVGKAAWERLGDHPLFAPTPANVPASPDRDVAAVQLLYNLGNIRFYQAIDLLERKGLMLDHCPACHAQWRGEPELPDEPCPDCSGALVRLTGWQTDEQLARPLPLPPRMIFRRRIDLEDEEESSGHHGHMDSSLMLPVLDPNRQLAAPDPPDVLVAEVVEKYRLLTAEELDEAQQLGEMEGWTLINILDQVGYLPPQAISFIRRKTGQAAPPEGDGLVELAVALGYLSPKIVPEGISAAMPEGAAFRLIEPAFSRGYLKPYQLIDLLETAGVRMEYCDHCQVQMFFDREEDAFVRHCPQCDEALVPLHRPEEELTGCWPENQPAAFYSYRNFRDGSPTLAESQRLAALVTDAGDAPTAGEVDLLVDRLIQRYRLMTDEERALARERFEGQEREAPWEQLLFEDGFIRADALNFLAQMREKLLAGDTVLGGMAAQPIGDIAVAKGYVTLLRYHKLFRLPGAPDPDGADEMAVAAYLFEKGAVTLFQLIHILEEKGLALLHCEACNKQFHVEGRLDPTVNHTCPHCQSVLHTLTALPGTGLRLEVLPTIESLEVERIQGNELAESSDSVASPAGYEGLEGSGLAAPPLAHILLDQVSDDESWVSSEARRKRVLELHKKQREAIDSFYQKEFPEQAMHSRAGRETRKILRPAIAGAAAGGVPSSSRQVAPSTSKRRAVALGSDGALRSASGYEEMLDQGLRQMRTIAALLCAAILLGVLAMIFSAREGQPAGKKRQAAKEPERIRPEVLKTTRRLTMYGQVDPDTIDLDGEVPQFLLAVDLDRHYWVNCRTPGAQQQLARLADYLEKLHKGGPIKLKVLGTLEKNQTGADSTPSGQTAYHISAIRIQRVFKLPEVRIQQH